MLFRIYAPRMLGVCLRYTCNKQEAEDVLQDSFIKVFKNIGSFNNENKGSIGGWIRRICVNTALNNYRDTLKYRQETDIDIFKGNIPDNTDDDEISEEPIEKEKILQIIHDLPAGYKLVFNLYVFEQYTHQQIADELNISANTSKTQLMKARTFIKKKILELQTAHQISKVI